MIKTTLHRICQVYQLLLGPDGGEYVFILHTSTHRQFQVISKDYSQDALQKSPYSPYQFLGFFERIPQKQCRALQDDFVPISLSFRVVTYVFALGPF